MPAPRLGLQNLNLADYDNIVAGLGDLTNERNLPQQFMNGLMTRAKKLLEFLKKPQQAIDALMKNARKLLDFLKKPGKFGIQILDTQPDSLTCLQMSAPCSYPPVSASQPSSYSSQALASISPASEQVRPISHENSQFPVLLFRFHLLTSTKAQWPPRSNPRSSAASRPQEVSSPLCNRWACSAPCCPCKSVSRASAPQWCLGSCGF